METRMMLHQTLDSLFMKHVSLRKLRCPGKGEDQRLPQQIVAAKRAIWAPVLDDHLLGFSSTRSEFRKKSRTTVWVIVTLHLIVVTQNQVANHLGRKHVLSVGISAITILMWITKAELVRSTEIIVEADWLKIIGHGGSLGYEWSGRSTIQWMRKVWLNRWGTSWQTVQKERSFSLLVEGGIKTGVQDNTKRDDFGNHESRGRSRSPEDLRSPYKSERRSTFRSPFQTPWDLHSVKRKSESRSVSPGRNSVSRSSSPDTRRGRHRRSRTSKSKYSARESSPYRRREASSSERDLEAVYQSRRRSKNNEPMDSKSPKHSRRRHIISPERDDKHRWSKASRSKRGSEDDEKSLSRHRSESSYLGKRDQSTRSSRRRSRRSKYSPNRRDSNERFYSKERRSRGQSDSPDHSSTHSPNHRRRRVPKDRTVKFSDWRPECQLQNIEARGGKRDFRKWFKVLPPNVKVDKDVRTDRGVFKKDNFQSSQALDKYLGM